MIAQIAQGIMAKYTGSALATSLTGGLWRETAKQDVSFPYGTFNIIDNVQMDGFTEKLEIARVQFNLWAKYTSSTTNPTSTLDSLESALRTLYDYATLTITSWTNLGMYYQSSRPAFSEDDDVVGVIVEYLTYITKSR